MGLDDIDPNSVPGFCVMAKYGSINREVLKITTNERGEKVFDAERVAILRYLTLERFNFMLNEQRIESDPIKVFVKQEPHKLKKLEEQRYRLIHGVSLVDSMIDRVLMGAMLRNATHPTNILTTPCVVGWNPSRGGWRALISNFTGGGFSIDRTAWDFTVQEWLVQMWQEFIFDMHPNAPDWWRKMVTNRFTALFYTARFRFPDGVEICQEKPGIMKSGCLLTLLLNSVGQTIMHGIVMTRLQRDPSENTPWCAGDDTLMHPCGYEEQYYDELSRLCLIKEAEVTAGYLEFIGFFFNCSGFYPAYWAKHLFQLRHLDPRVEREALISYQYLWYNHPPMLKFVQEFAFRVSPSLVLPHSVLREKADR